MFSYPFGVPGADVDARAVRAVGAAGYSLAVINQEGTISDRTDPLQVPRRAVPNVGGAEFRQWLAHGR